MCMYMCICIQREVFEPFDVAGWQVQEMLAGLSQMAMVELNGRQFDSSQLCG